MYVCDVFASWVTATLVVPDPTVAPLASDDAQVYPVIAEPPVAGAVQETASERAEVVTVGALGVAGTVVAVIEAEALEASEVPDAFVAVTVNVYAVLDCKPVTVSGDDDPVAVYDPGEDVAVNDVAVAPAPAVKVTVADPLLNARPDPASVAETLVGVLGAPLAEEAIVPRISITKYLLQRTRHLSLHVRLLRMNTEHEVLVL